MENDHALTLTVEQAAAVLGIGRSTLYRKLAELGIDTGA